MRATFAIERLSDNGDWKLDGTMEIQIPFARAKFNFVLELTATLSNYLQKSVAPNGTYRIGFDDNARIEWKDGSPRVLADVRKLGDGADPEVKDAIATGIIEASRERN